MMSPNGTENHSTPLDALEELVEAFMGLSSELEWCTSEDISRKELLPIMRMCASGTLSPDQSLDVVLANVMVKKDETFAVMKQIVTRLNSQLSSYDLVSRTGDDSSNGIDDES